MISRWGVWDIENVGNYTLPIHQNQGSVTGRKWWTPVEDAHDLLPSATLDRDRGCLMDCRDKVFSVFTGNVTCPLCPKLLCEGGQEGQSQCLEKDRGGQTR